MGHVTSSHVTLHVTRTLLGVDDDRCGRYESKLAPVTGHDERSVLVVVRRYYLVLGAICLGRAHRPALLLGRVGAVGRGAGLSRSTRGLYDAARRIHAPRYAVVLGHYCRT